MRSFALTATAVVMLANWWSRWAGERHHGGHDTASDARARAAFARRTLVETATKPLATVGVVGIAILGDASTTAINVAVLALVACLVGDIALLPLIDRFRVGLTAFAIAHLLFILLFAVLGLDRLALGGVALVLAGLMIATVGHVIVQSAAHRDAGLHTPVLGYLVVVSLMAAAGWATGRPVVAVGVTSFVVSDAVLGWRTFVRPLRHGAVIVMVTYHLAIGALALSLW